MPVTSTHLSCVTSVKNAVVSLDLTEDGAAMAGDRANAIDVYEKTIPLDDKSRPLPYVIVCPFGQERHNSTDGGSDHDIIKWPVLVGLVAAGNRATGTGATNPTLFFGWREIAMKHFIKEKRLNGGLPAEVDFIEVEPLDVMQPNAWFDFNLYSGGFVVLCNERVKRS